jgi:phospholipid-binding lipoprotein MlaA
MHPPRSLFARLLPGCSLVLALAGCATGPNPQDPFEVYNRSVYRFNETVDKAVMKPVAQGYTKAVPLPVRGGVTNFFGNFRDVTTAINSVLQLKFGAAASTVGRVALNSTVGILGVFDVATPLGLERHDEDFGQTLGHWGVQPGPYVVLPLLGPSTVRDTAGLVGDYFTDPQFDLFEEYPTDWIVLGIRLVNLRANLLEAGRLLDQVALDRYAFLRDAYLQRRRSLVYDGNPPAEGGADGPPRRKTLKELEEELELDEPAQPPAPDSP